MNIRCQNYTGRKTSSHRVSLDVAGKSLYLWFSYETLVAVKAGGLPLAVVENSWGPTTGRHLNDIDDGNKKARLSQSDFDAAVERALIAFGLSVGDVLARAHGLDPTDYVGDGAVAG